jgi:hypothetical protein
MFGCIGKLGCLALIAVLALGGWYTRPYWYPRARALVVAAPPAANITWKPITAEAAARGTRVAERLGEKSGPVFADLTPAEFAAWQLEPAMKILGGSSGNPEASVHGDTLFVRANVSIAELGDPKSLGPLASMLDGRQPVLIGGRLEAVKPGLLSFRVTQMTVKELRLPDRLVAKIVGRISVKERTDSLAPGAISIPVPKSVADVRITNGRVVLYKAVP